MSEIHENIDLVLGIRNVFELEGVTFTFTFIKLNIVPSQAMLIQGAVQKSEIKTFRTMITINLSSIYEANKLLT